MQHHTSNTKDKVGDVNGEIIIEDLLCFSGIFKSSFRSQGWKCVPSFSLERCSVCLTVVKLHYIQKLRYLVTAWLVFLDRNGFQNT